MPTINISSLPGIHQNSNVTTGGGTDDTSIIQAALTAGPFPLTLVQDGASLVTGLNIGSNTTIQCNNATQGFYLANSSNRALLRNVNRSGSIITDINITINGGTWNGNIANQTYSALHLETDGTPMSIMQFYGIANLVVENLTAKNQVYAAVGFGTFNNVSIHDCSFTAADNTTLNVTCVDCRGPGTGAVLQTLTCLVGDDAIAFNTRDYRGIVNIGPYILGGTLNNVVVDTVSFTNCWSGIDILTDATKGYTVNDIYMQNLTGSVQNFAVYLNRDLFNSPAATGVCTNLYLAGLNTVTLSGSPPPFGGQIPAGLWLIDVTCNNLNMSGFGNTLPQTITFPTSAGNTTGLVLMGTSRGAFTGATTAVTNAVTIVGGTQKAQVVPNGSGTSIAKAYPANVTAGTKLVVFASGFFSGGCTITNIVDTLGNSYLGNEIAAFTDGATGHVAKLYAVTNVGAGANTVTVTFGQSTAGSTLWVAEYGVSTLDQISSILIDVGAETSVTCPSITTTKTNEVVLGLGSTHGTSGATPTNSYTLEVAGTGSGISCLIDKQIAAISANAPGWTQSSTGNNYRCSMSLAGYASQGSWVISGNAGVAGASVAYSGSSSGTVTAGSSGNYSISGLAAGTYTITPTKSGYVFTPTSLSPAVTTTKDTTGVVFTAVSNSSIAGQAGAFLVGP